MAKHVISSHETETYSIAGTPGDRWVFTQSFLMDGAASYGVAVDASSPKNDIEFYGTITGAQAALISFAKKTDFLIGKTADLGGDVAVVIGGDKSTIRNEATITTSSAGLFSVGGSHQTITNFGNVASEIAIDFSTQTDSSTAINGKGGVLYGTMIGILIDSVTEGSASRIENYGTIESDAAAIATGYGDETVINRGYVNGEVYLGEGNDVFDTIGGHLSNASHGVRGGYGDDTLLTSDGQVMLIETASGGTNDTVKADVNYTLSAYVENLVLLGKANLKGTGDDLDNSLYGNDGNNVLKGMLGDDHLYGGKGKDTLIGGGGFDTFHFSTGDGKDKIADYENAFDFIDLSDCVAITGFKDLMKHHIEFKDGDAIISDGKDVLTIKNITEAELDVGDFRFEHPI